MPETRQHGFRRLPECLATVQLLILAGNSGVTKISVTKWGLNNAAAILNTANKIKSLEYVYLSMTY